MRLRPRAHQLIFAVEGEDVVTQDIVSAIVLVKACALAAIHDIFLDEYVARTFICVDSPSSISERRNIVYEIVSDHSSRLLAESIDPAHIAQCAFSYSV